MCIGDILRAPLGKGSGDRCLFFFYESSSLLHGEVKNGVA